MKHLNKTNLTMIGVAVAIGLFFLGESKRAQADAPVQFRDGTTVEELNTGGMGFFQIKQPDGRICYGNALIAGSGVSITCLSK